MRGTVVPSDGGIWEAESSSARPLSIKLWCELIETLEKLRLALGRSRWHKMRQFGDETGLKPTRPAEIAQSLFDRESGERDRLIIRRNFVSSFNELGDFGGQLCGQAETDMD